MAEALQMCCAGQVKYRATASRLLQQHLPRRTEAGRILSWRCNYSKGGIGGGAGCPDRYQ
jgi:hypothetical protein